LGISNVDPNNRHVELGRHLDDMRLGSENNIVEQVVVLEDASNFIQRNTTVGFLANEGNIYNLEIQFVLGKPGWQNLICIRRK